MPTMTVDAPDALQEALDRTADEPARDLVIRDAAQEIGRWDEATQAIVLPTPVGGMELAFTAGQRTLDAKQMMLLGPLGIAADWPPSEVQVFLLLCLTRGFDPWANEAYLMRYNTAAGPRFVRHIGIAGFRRKAEETRRWEGLIGPQYTADGKEWLDIWPRPNEAPLAARAGILKTGFRQTLWGTALYDEFAPMKDEWINNHKTGKKVPVPMWLPGRQGGKASHMLGKVAQAVAFRGAFPGLNGWYLEEELHQLRYGQQQTTNPHATVMPADVTQRLQEAYTAQNPTPPTIGATTIDGTAVETPTPPTPPAPVDGPDDPVWQALHAEAVEQAEILGRSLDQMTARWVASHEGRPFHEATIAEIRTFVHRCRPYIVTALRDANRDTEADRYANAPDHGTVHDLFGRGPAVPEPPQEPTA